MNRISALNDAITGSKEVCIVAAGRSPMCSYKGDFRTLSAVDLGTETLRRTLSKFGIPPSEIQEFYLGNVYPGGLGQSPAKQISLRAGLPESTICTNVNKVCSSGMLAITAASMAIAQGLQEVVAVGGVEIMTNVPYYQERGGLKRGDGMLIDGLIKDGLWDPKYNVHMGECAERCREKYNVSREEMDNFARESYEKANRAWEQGKFSQEVVPITTPKGLTVNKDALKGKNTNFAKMRPAFRKTNGQVTAGNASPLSDGAAMLVLCSRNKAQQMGWNVLATVSSFAHAEQDNLEFLTSPYLAMKKAAERAGLSMNQIDFFEINEAFSVAGIVNPRLMNVDPAKVNVYGGAVALGHPLGCSGARIVVTLLSVLRQEGGRFGGATICNGGGGGSALVLKV